MEWFDWLGIIFTFISGICTFVSIWYSYKSKDYFTKSKDLVTYKNINIAHENCKTIIEIFPQLILLSNEQISRRGKNISNELAEYGKTMKKSLSLIRHNMYEQDSHTIKDFLDSNETELEKYIDSLISGSVIKDNKFITDDDLAICQKNINKLQELIKDRFYIISEKLK